MKAQEFIKLIDKLVEKRINVKVRQLIKEEVASQVNATMGKMLVEALTRGGVQTRKDYVSNQEVPTPSSPINTTNPKLNAVLAETARDFKPLRKDIQGSLAELLDGDFKKIGSSEDVYEEERSVSELKQNINDGTNVGFLKQIVSEGITTGTPQQSVLGTEAVPDTLKSVFKRDFRDVMKKMDEQKKFGSHGLINPQMVLSG